MLEYRNQQDKIIVCYTNDDRQCSIDCQNLVVKGFDNIYILVGGFNIFKEREESLISGKVAFKEVLAKKNPLGKKPV